MMMMMMAMVMMMMMTMIVDMMKMSKLMAVVEDDGDVPQTMVLETLTTTSM